MVTFMGSLFMSILSPLWVKQADAAVTRFASGSFWDVSVPSYTSLHPDSDSLVANIVDQVNTYGAAVVRDGNASPVYEVDAGVTPVSVIPYDCGSGIPADLANQWSAVPIPFHAVPSGGSNSQMVVYQPSTSSVWEFGHMRNVSGQWEACTGGRITTNSGGVFPSPYGVTTSGLAVLGGQLSIEELQSGQINHVIGLNLPQTSGVVWPASQAGSGSAGSPAMGQRFRLDPNINVDSLGLSPVARAIAKAGQTYGFVVWNKGDSVGFTGENAISSTSRGLPDPYSSLLSSGGLSGFPWGKLQALPSNYGQSSGVPAITKFSASQASVKADTRVTLTWQATNVTRCAIGGVADNLSASGSVQTEPLGTNSTFSLRCGGPLGTTTSQVTVRVTPINTNEDRRNIGPGSLIDQPYAGYANIFPDLMAGEAAEGVYKVVYYEQKVYLYETATPPFALNTLRLANGAHTINAKIFYRDGRTTERVLGISVSNTPEVLQAVTQSAPIKAAPTLPLLWGVIGGLLASAVMGVGTWWGWHRAHMF